MNTSHSANGFYKKRARHVDDSFPYPRATFAAIGRDPEAFLALIYALERLLSDDSEQSASPGSTTCPLCHSGY